MPEDVFRYKVELDTQGLAAQLSSVQASIGQGLSGVASGMVGGAGAVQTAAGQVTNDLVIGQQMMSAAIPQRARAVFGGMMNDLPLAFGASPGASGMFPQEVQAMAKQRMAERMQLGATGFISGVAEMGVAGLGAWAFSGAGAVAGIAGGFLGFGIGAAAMGAVVGNVENRMAERARLTRTFGFNRFSADQRDTIVDQMGQAYRGSIFSSDQFNQVLPAGVMAGFFGGGVGAREAGGRFSQAEQFLARGTFALGTDDVMAVGMAARGIRRAGIRDFGEVSTTMARAGAVARQMMDVGDYITAEEALNQQLAMGSVGRQMGLSPQKAMDMAANQASIATRLVANKEMTGEELALLGGTTGQAAQQTTTALMRTAKHPIFRMMALAYGSTDAGGGRPGIAGADLESLASGRVSFSALSERMLQQFGSGQDGATKMMTLLANQNKLTSDMMAAQGQALHSLTDDILRQSGMDSNDETKKFIMQRVFGVAEAESTALVKGAKIEQEVTKDLRKKTGEFMLDVESAVQQSKDGFVAGIKELQRTIIDEVGEPLDNISRAFGETLFRPIEGRIAETPRSASDRISYSRNSPIAAGSIDTGEGADDWMIPKDSEKFYSFRAANASRDYPMAMLSMGVEDTGMVPNLTRLTSLKETMAG